MYEWKIIKLIEVNNVLDRAKNHLLGGSLKSVQSIINQKNRWPFTCFIVDLLQSESCHKYRLNHQPEENNMVGMRVSTMQINAAFAKLSASGLGRNIQTEIQRRQADVKTKDGAKAENSTTEKKQTCECNKKPADIKTEIKNAVAQKDYEKVAQLAGVKSPFNNFSYKGLSLFKVNA
ncbi:hypothetical protein YF83_12470 [Salmonella enterica subsp. enterica serovar Newport]|nr:hypothetical protein [Salmonella enterica subsp. enterica serovar Newport]ECV9048865.1 hypothetical protein [Salmonella enterica subsp. enterica serovar Newport]